MSTVVGTIFPSQNAGIILSSDMKKEVEQKTDKMESMNCELKANADICKDLIKEISKKTDHSPEDDDDLKFEDCEEQLEKDDKDDESLNNQKQQLTGNIDLCAVIEENKKPEVQILSLTVLSPGRADVVLQIPFPTTTSKATLFTLKEGSRYRIKFLFTVTQNVVKNLTYTYMVWKAGVRVHQTKKLIGTFSPRQEQYTLELEEGITPSGFFARGPFLVRSKFIILKPIDICNVSRQKGFMAECGSVVEQARDEGVGDCMHCRLARCAEKLQSVGHLESLGVCVKALTD